jgi:hypothetical protein
MHIRIHHRHTALPRSRYLIDKKKINFGVQELKWLVKPRKKIMKYWSSLMSKCNILTVRKFIAHELYYD